MFVGRTRELAELERLYAQGGFQMVVLYGRRRVGKTALATRFAEGKPTLSYTAKVQSAHLNLRDFSVAAYRCFGLPVTTGAFASWEDALRFVADRAGDEHLVFVFDEFPYAAQRDEALVSTLQVVIDRYLSSTNVFLIISGSNQGFMEERVLGGGTGALGERDPLFGRRTAQLHLAPFGYRESALMLPGVEPEELVRYFAVFGGTPYYLSALNPDEGLGANVERLYFHKTGLLYEEPLMLLRQELREPMLYSSVLDALASGANRPQAIADRIGEERALVGKYLQTLASMGLVRKVLPFGEGPRSRKGIYEIADPAFSFWYRFVRPNVDAIELDAGSLAARDLRESEAVPAYVGRWFERVCLEWTVAQAKAGELPFVPTRFGRWWGADPTVREQADIDVVAANARTGDLLVGECKWRSAFDETAAVRTLERRGALVGDYGRVWHALFSRRPVRERTRQKADGSWRFVDVEVLYR